MSSGNSFLRKIDSVLSRLEDTVRGQSSRMGDLRTQQARLRGVIAESLLKIARTQAEALDRNEIEGYDVATRDLDRKLEQRAAAGQALAELQDRSRRELHVERTREHELGEKADAIVARIRAVQQKAKGELDGAAEFQGLVQAADDAACKAGVAQSKADTALTERKTKSGAYLADPLFCYLRDRGFGTEQYRASPVVRTIDGWVANLCNYRQAIRDFEALQMLPDYLSSHARAMDAARQAAVTVVEEARRRSLVSAGIEPHEQELEAVERDMDKVRERAQRFEVTAASAQQQIAQFSNWRDLEAIKLMDLLGDVLNSESLGTLEQRVLRTTSSADDQALDDLRVAKDRLKALERDIHQVEQESTGYTARLESIRRVREQYRSKRFHTSEYRIRGNAADERLDGFLAGAVVESDLWHVIANSVVYDPPASTSSSRSSSGGGSFGGGGFKSGGSFGGGGFKTGGGF